MEGELKCLHSLGTCILEEIRDGYFLLQEERIILAGGKLVAVEGYKAEDLIGKSFLQFVPLEEQERVRRLASNQVAGRYETVILAGDGTRMPVEVVVWPTGYQGRPAVAGIVADISGRKKQQAEILRAQEEERKRLARALHDETIQELLIVCHRLQDIAAGTHGRLPKPAREHLAEVRALVERTMNEVRGFTENLRPAILDDMGLVPALRWLTSRLAAGDGLHAGVQVLGEERRLSPDAELTLFRIAQEALSNVRRHANASAATVTLQFSESKVTMAVSDDGRGFEPLVTATDYAKYGKLGLAGIIERVLMLGGTQKIESAPGKGTVLTVEVAM